MKLVTVAQMREIDRIAIKERGIDAFELMEAAGRAVATDIAEHFEKGSVAIICGGGNNGGDGHVAARYLHRAGWNVRILTTVPMSESKGAARKARERLPDGVKHETWDRISSLQWLSDMDVTIDALLGTGSKGKLRPPYDALIQAMNEAHTPIVSIDIPSGLNADTGFVDDVAVIAYRTVTIGLPKVGLVTGDGPRHAGVIRVEHIQFPQDLLEGSKTDKETLTTAEAAHLLPDRPEAGYKGTFGLLTVIAGSEVMPGAAVLAGIGALRGGCGLVRMHVPRSIRHIVMHHIPEAMLSGPDAGEDFLQPISEDSFNTAILKAKAVIIGPAMGLGESSIRFLEQVLQNTNMPMVLDADALTILADRPELRRHLKEYHILTPHPGEMSRVLGISNDEVQRNRWNVAQRAAEELNCTVVLKGYGTLVAEPDGRVTHIGSGNTAWARGGAGDVLAGVIGSLLAQGISAAAAAKLGSFVHGMAADHCTKTLSARGLLTREVAAHLPHAFRELEHVKLGTTTKS